MLARPYKPRILMFGPDLSATTGISNVVNNWIEAGLQQKVELEYIPTLKQYVSKRYFFKTMEALKAYSQFIKKTFAPIDIVHIHFAEGMSFYRKLIIFEYAKIKRLKIVVHMHVSDFETFYEKAPKFQKKLIELFLNRADSVFVLSESWKHLIQKISNNRNIYIVYNGALIKKFAGKITDGERINISFMGRLGKRKGTYDLLEAFKKLSHEIPQVNLLLGGDGDINGVKRIVFENKLENRVAVLGWVSGQQKIEVFQKSDIYALPSYNEGLPGSILEAMAAGAPIVSTPIGAIPEAVIEGRNGFLVKPGDVGALYHRLKLLSQDKKLREKMGTESKLILQEKFDINKIVVTIANIYTEILA